MHTRDNDKIPSTPAKEEAEKQISQPVTEEKTSVLRRSKLSKSPAPISEQAPRRKLSKSPAPIIEQVPRRKSSKTLIDDQIPRHKSSKTATDEQMPSPRNNNSIQTPTEELSLKLLPRKHSSSQKLIRLNLGSPRREGESMPSLKMTGMSEDELGNQATPLTPPHTPIQSPREALEPLEPVLRNSGSSGKNVCRGRRPLSTKISPSMQNALRGSESSPEGSLSPRMEVKFKGDKIGLLTQEGIHLSHIPKKANVHSLFGETYSPTVVRARSKKSSERPRSESISEEISNRAAWDALPSEKLHSKTDKSVMLELKQPKQSLLEDDKLFVLTGGFWSDWDDTHPDEYESDASVADSDLKALETTPEAEALETTPEAEALETTPEAEALEIKPSIRFVRK